MYDTCISLKFRITYFGLDTDQENMVGWSGSLAIQTSRLYCNVKENRKKRNQIVTGIQYKQKREHSAQRDY